MGFDENKVVPFLKAGNHYSACLHRSNKACVGKMTAKALNMELLEIGRAIVDAAFTADDAKYVTFKLNEEMDAQLVGKCLIDLKNKIKGWPNDGKHIETAGNSRSEFSAKVQHQIWDNGCLLFAA
ncbi:MAG: hypothetical protein EHM45_20150 [Desulfobacteraceae bacterium]|nr:MAG: hypothetical protein EHM45_20150 [Desulfobacteraceae bacterium]